MDDLPTATGPLPMASALREMLQPLRAVDLPAPGDGRTEYAVAWARHHDEVREAQRLRFDVFASEMGARLISPEPGHDIDLFDDYCEHLLVRDARSHQVIGTYRVLTPAQARRVGCTYSDTEFDLTRLRGLRDRMVELGRSCVHPEHRQGGVILALWGALADFMVRNRLDTMMGCASIPDAAPGRGERRCRGQHLAAAAPDPPGADRVPGAAAPAAAGGAARRLAATSSRRRSSRATCAWAPRCWARRPGTPTSTPRTCR